MKSNSNREIIKLENGLVVGLQKTNTPTISSVLKFHIGAFHETQSEKGLAHLLEHSISHGSSKKYSLKESTIIENSFGETNASTSHLSTSYTASFLKDNLEYWLEFISDKTFNPLLRTRDLDEERKRVLREIADYKSDKDHELVLKFRDFFYRGHPKGIILLGDEEIVKNASPVDLKHFHKKGYFPNNCYLALAGGLPENNKTLKIIKKYFSDFEKGETTKIKFPELEQLKNRLIINEYAPEKLNKENPLESSADIRIYFVIPSMANSDYFPLVVLNNLLSGTENNSLYQRLGTKKGLAYATKSSISAECNVGEFKLMAKVPVTRIEEAVESMFETLNNFKTRKLKKQELEPVKNFMVYQFAKTLELNEGQIKALEFQMKEGFPIERIMEAYSKVTPNDIWNVANKYLPNKEGNYFMLIQNPIKKD